MDYAVNEAIARFIDFVNISQKDFASRVGVTPQTINNIIKHNRQPGLDLLRKILIAYPRLDANYLLRSGWDSYYLEDDGKGDSGALFNREATEAIAREDMILLLKKRLATVEKLIELGETTDTES